MSGFQSPPSSPWGLQSPPEVLLDDLDVLSINSISIPRPWSDYGEFSEYIRYLLKMDIHQQHRKTTGILWLEMFKSPTCSCFRSHSIDCFFGGKTDRIFQSIFPSNLRLFSVNFPAKHGVMAVTVPCSHCNLHRPTLKRIY